MRPPPGRGEIVALLRENGIRPSRALGQNFVADPNTVERIARLAGVGPADRVVEIGAGLGSLTLALAATGARITAMEIDKRLVGLLREMVEPAGVRVLEADALGFEWPRLLEEDQGEGGQGPWSLVANLPYNVATPLVVQVLEGAPQVGRILVMVQREVGERLAAPPGSSAYGAVSVKVAYFASASVIGRVSPEVFVPRPNVESALVRIDRRPSPAVPPAEVPYDELFELVRRGFAGRRKMLRRSLAGFVPPEAFAAAGIAPDARAETLGVEEWGTLARCRRSIGSSPPPS